MTSYYDALETRDPELREREQFAALRKQIANAQANAPYFARLLADVDADDMKDRAALAKLPVTRKSDFTELQKHEFRRSQACSLSRPASSLAFSCRRVPFSIPKPGVPISGEWRAHCTQRDFAQASSSTTPFPITSRRRAS